MGNKHLCQQPGQNGKEGFKGGMKTREMMTNDHARNWRFVKSAKKKKKCGVYGRDLVIHKTGLREDHLKQ